MKLKNFHFFLNYYYLNDFLLLYFQKEIININISEWLYFIMIN